MNVRFLNPFLEAANDVLHAETGLTVTKGKIELEKSALTTEDITVLISIVGAVQGVALYGLSTRTALNLVTRMMGQEFTEFDNLARSGIAEMGNVITGRASIKFSEDGMESNISPPTVIEGQGAKVSMVDFSRIIIPLTTDAGIITAHLALRESSLDHENNNFVQLIPDAIK
ncbi:MAG: chemotaxis protein CheX [Anaerolineales bacterium]|nr:chemotaxis protein CheX [Anaerolineales bacterium]